MGIECVFVRVDEELMIPTVVMGSDKAGFHG
jgi:hypothetical protein